MSYLSKFSIYLSAVVVCLNVIAISPSIAQTIPTQSKSTSSASETMQFHKNQPIHYYGPQASKTGPAGKEVYKLWGVNPETHRRPEIYLEKDQTTINGDTIWYYAGDSIFNAVGNVKIVKVDPVKGNLVAVSRKAKFDQGKNQITLEEKAKVTQGQNVMEGDIIVITQGEEGSTVEVENASGVLYPQEKPDSK